MQKKRLALILLLIASIFGTASSYADGVVEVSGGGGAGGGGRVSAEEIIREVDLYEGWNLIPMADDGIEFEFEGDFGDILEAAYLYDPYSREYYDLLEDEDILEDFLEERKFTAIWVYLNEDAEMTLRVDLEDIQEIVEDLDFEFVEGWNFYVVLPHMYKDYEEGYLNIGTDEYGDIYLAHDRLYAWDSRYKDWDGARYSDLIEDDDLSDPQVIGLPIVMNYIDDFTVSFTPRYELSVPDFPEI